MTAALTSPRLSALQRLRRRVEAEIRKELTRLRNEALPKPETRPALRHQNRGVRR